MKKSTKIQKGFTLIETMIVLSVISLILIAVYNLANVVSSSTIAANEAENIDLVIEKIERFVALSGSFENINQNVFDDITEKYVSNFDLVNVTSNFSSLKIAYQNIQVTSCTKFAEKLLIKNENLSLIINGTNVPPYSDISIISANCNKNLNSIDVVLNNNNLTTKSNILNVVPVPPPVRQVGIPYVVVPFAKSAVGTQLNTGSTYSSISLTGSGVGYQ